MKRPMKPENFEFLFNVRWPLLASPKMDGIRAMVYDGKVYSSSGKPIPNRYVQLHLAGYDGMDGELIVGDPTDPNVMQKTMSGVMSIEGEPDVSFHVFDYFNIPQLPYHERLQVMPPYRGPMITVVKHTRIENHLQMEAYEQTVLAQGYEGIILRDPTAWYKFGRSTLREQGMLRLKRFSDDEAVIIGFQERMHNGNPLRESPLGYAERATDRAGLSGRGDLGAFLVRRGDGIEFAIGTGFTDADRKLYWGMRDMLLGQIVKYKHFAVCGTKDAPRFPTFIGLRDPRDL